MYAYLGRSSQSMGVRPLHAWPCVRGPFGSQVCGWDQFNDFHYSVATRNWLPLSEAVLRVETLNTRMAMLMVHDSWCVVLGA